MALKDRAIWSCGECIVWLGNGQIGITWENHIDFYFWKYTWTWNIGYLYVTVSNTGV